MTKEELSNYNKNYLRKFGVKKLVGANMEIICKDCGLRLGLHCGPKCPTEWERMYEEEIQANKGR